ncbi:MAG: ABC transporter permease [Deltaproteobacteria bacterium]
MRRPRSELFGMAFETLRRNPGRSALTLLGLAIGVGAFIAMVSFGEGARRSVMDQFKALGTHLVRVRGTSRGGQERRPLSDADIAAIQRDSTTISKVIPVARVIFETTHAGHQWWSPVHGTEPEFATLHTWDTSLGGLFDARDLARRSKVCVIGQTVVRELFGEADADPLGETVTISGILTCRVIGVLAAKGTSTSGNDVDDIVLIPVTTFAAYFGLPLGYSALEIGPAQPEWIEAAKEEAHLALRRSHGLGVDDADDFQIDSPTEVLKAVDRTATILARLLQGIAAVSLFVGGVGIMNIQLVSVTERTAEIGIRAAIGASPRQILAQFLVEGALLSLLGASFGILIGVGVSVGVANYMGWQRITSFGDVAGAAAFGIAVGLVFGFLPARRAAMLDPIEALRRQ